MQLFESKTVLFRIISIVRVLPLLYSNAKHNSHDDELQNRFLSGKLGISKFDKIESDFAVDDRSLMPVMHGIIGGKQFQLSGIWSKM